MLIPVYLPDPAHSSFRIYSKAKRQQWNASEHIDWTLPHLPDPAIAAVSPGLARELDRYFFSQLFFGEQAAMMACGQLLGDAPDMESRLYLASQVYDEARHVEVFGRLSEMLGGVNSVKTPFTEIFERGLAADLYETRILCTHVLVEGAGLVALRALRETTHSPLVATILDSVMEDEARHTGFGEAELRMRASTWSPALRSHLEGTLADWWRLYCAGHEVEDGELMKLLPQRVRDVLRTMRRERLEVLASIQIELRKRLQRYGLTLRGEAVRPDLGTVA
jgi:hypothetical protein